MGRHPRVQAAGIYHLMARSSAEERIFRTTADYIEFVTLLGGSGITCHGFCVLRTHYHVIGTLQHDCLAKEMHRLNRLYAVAFNRRHGRRGRVFDRPYHSVPVESDAQLVWLARYVAQNPLNPRRWQWSSFVTDYSFVDMSPLEAPFGDRERLLQFVFDPLFEPHNVVQDDVPGVRSPPTFRRSAASST
jgi:hypothetical protein